MFASLALCGFCFTYLISYQVLEKQFQTVQIAIEKFIVYPFPPLSLSFFLSLCLSFSLTHYASTLEYPTDCKSYAI